jgi:hypothetical protein
MVKTFCEAAEVPTTSTTVPERIGSSEVLGKTGCASILVELTLPEGAGDQTSASGLPTARETTE